MNSNQLPLCFGTKSSGDQRSDKCRYCDYKGECRKEFIRRWKNQIARI